MGKSVKGRLAELDYRLSVRRQEAHQGTEEEVMGLNPRFAPSISSYQDTDTRTMRKPIEEEAMRISASGSGIVFEEEKGKDMNEKLGPFDKCDESVVVDQSLFEKQSVGSVLAKARQAYADRTQSRDSDEPIKIVNEVLMSQGPGPRNFFRGEPPSNDIGLPEIGAVYPAPQEKQVDPMWDTYFELAFTNSVLTNGAEKVEMSAYLADLMVAEREKRKK